MYIYWNLIKVSIVCEARRWKFSLHNVSIVLETTDAIVIHIHLTLGNLVDSYLQHLIDR